MKAFTLFLGGTVFATVSCVHMVSAGELRPLVLPSTQQGYIQQQRPAEPSSASLYTTFEEKVKHMTPEQKNAYKERYTKGFNEAKQNNDYRRVEHFNRLLGILSRY